MKRLNFTTMCVVAFGFCSGLHASEDQALIEKGKYLAQAADCFACHTTDDGKKFGGGKAFELPLGMTVYSTNISPDTDFGIGSYTLEDFSNSVREGKSSIRGYLYPAMPYMSYKLITDDDIEALFAYFQSIEPVKQPNIPNDLIFPANIRTGVVAWDLIAGGNDAFEMNPDKSEAWNRGNYLVNALGHCGECHTPRNLIMAVEKDKPFHGAMVGNTWAPNITSENLRELGWGTEDLKDLLKKGYADKGVVTGEMYTAVKHSLSQLTESDLDSVVTYLLDSDEKLASKRLRYSKAHEDHPGYSVYMSYCAACHGTQGQGKPNFAPRTLGNTSLAKENQYNTFSAILAGIEPQHYSKSHKFDAMPAYNDKLSNQQLLDLVNYLSISFTEAKDIYSMEYVAELRAEIVKDHNLEEN